MPFRGIEADNVDRVKLLEANGDECFGEAVDLFAVLRPCPGCPFRIRSGASLYIIEHK